MVLAGQRQTRDDLIDHDALLQIAPTAQHHIKGDLQCNMHINAAVILILLSDGIYG